MKKYIQYLKYIFRHKYYVYQYCRILKVGLFRSIVHDWTKFLPCEFIAYTNKFYGDKDKHSNEKFLDAWNHHQKANKHHWQYWVLINDTGIQQALIMPRKYAKEMVADWCGAGYAINGKLDVVNWYEKNKDKMMLNPCTRWYVESLLKDLE